MWRLTVGRCAAGAALLLAVGAGGWQALRPGVPRPPARPVALHNQPLTEFHCAINGLDPLQTPISLAARERCLLDVRYTRQPAPGETYDQIVLLLVCDDGSPHGKIEMQSFLGDVK